MSKALSLSFFKNSDVVGLSERLIGKILCVKHKNVVLRAVVNETEAYCGLTDQACHAYLNKWTNRTKVFYEAGGLTYVYNCYGIHNLLNIIVGKKDEPKAILIRSAIPISNLDTLAMNRSSKFELKMPKNNLVETVFSNKKIMNLTNGPGKLTQALNIKMEDNKISLKPENKIWIEKSKIKLKTIATPRIGIEYAGEDKHLPWRFLGVPMSV